MRAGHGAIAFLLINAMPLAAQPVVGFTTVPVELRAGWERTRSVVLLVWMPLVRGGAPIGVTQGDYVRADTSTPATGPLPWERYAALLSEAGPVHPAAVDSLGRLERPVARAPGLPSVPHPVIVITTGMNAPAYLHVTLAERLAAQGFLVVAVPTGLHAGRARLAFDSAGIQAHVDDLRAVVRQVLQWPAADPARVALAAWSVGGVAAAVVAEEVPGIRALVSLDAATGYAYGVDHLARRTSRAWRSRVPYLDLRGAVESPVERSDEFLHRRCGTTAHRAVVEGIAHRHFVSLWSTLAPEAPPEDVSAGVEAWEDLVARFVEAAVRGDGEENVRWPDRANGPIRLTRIPSALCPAP